MWARWTCAALAAVCLTGCVSNPSYRPCGPGYLNNIFVPQGFAGTDFRRACQKHDDCYEAGCDRKACDDRFYNDMLGACECSDAPCLCRLRAWQWYVQVRLFGGFGYGATCGNPGCPRCRSQGDGCCAPCGSGEAECAVPSAEY
jgi:hypothetical protein